MKLALGGVANAFHLQGALGPFSDVIDQAQQQLETLKGKGMSVGKAMSGIGVAAMAAGGIFTAEAQPDIQATDQLKTAVENAGQSYDAYKGKIEAAVKSQEKYGNTAVTTKNALQTLVQGTGSTTTALKLLGTASDLAAAKHMSLTDAANQLVKVYAGKGSRTLASFGIDTTKLADHTKELAAAQTQAQKAATNQASANLSLFNIEASLHAKTKLTADDHLKLYEAQQKAKTAAYENAVAQNQLAKAHQAAAGAETKGQQAIDLLTQKIKGQANAAADNLGGRFRALRAEVLDTAASIGEKYGPAITAAGAAMTVVTPVAKGVWSGIKGIGSAAQTAYGLVGKLELGQKAAAAASKIMAAGEAALNVVMDANPIVLVVAAITALVAIFYELYEHVGPVHDAIDALGRGIADFASGAKSVVMDVWNSALKPFFDFIISTIRDYLMMYIKTYQVAWQVAWEAIGTAVKVFKDDVFTPFKNAVSLIFQGIQYDVNAVESVWSNAWHLMGSAISGLESIASSVWSGIGNAIRGGIDDVIGLINDFIGFINSVQIHIPSVGVGPFHTPSFDWGGLHLPTIPMLAKGGIVMAGGTAIVGDAGPELLNLPAGAKVSPLGNKTGGDTIVINMTVQGTVKSERDLITAIQAGLYKLGRRNGSALAGVA